MYRLLSNDNQ